MPNDGVVVVVAVDEAVAFGGSAVALPNEKRGAAAVVTTAAVTVEAAELVVKPEIPVEPKDNGVLKLIGLVTDELVAETSEVVVLLAVDWFAPNKSGGIDGANLGGETDAADDTMAAEMAGVDGEKLEEPLVTDTTTSSGLFGEKANPPLRGGDGLAGGSVVLSAAMVNLIGAVNSAEAVLIDGIG